VARMGSIEHPNSVPMMILNAMITGVGLGLGFYIVNRIVDRKKRT